MQLYPEATFRFLTENSATLRSIQTRTSYGAMLRNLDQHVGKALHRITEKDLVDWVQLPPAPASVRNRTKIVRSFFDWATWAGLVVNNPAQHLRRLVPVRDRATRRHNWLTEDEVGLVLRSIDPVDSLAHRDRIVLMVGFFTGLRIHELVNLRWGDFDLRAQTINVLGKGEKLATIGMPDQLREALSEWKDVVAKGLDRDMRPTDPVFPRGRRLTTFDGTGYYDRIEWDKPLGAAGIRNLVARHGRTAGVTDFAPHDMRRSFAGILEAKGVPLPDISRALRHSDLATTTRYLESNPARTVQAVKGLTMAL